MPSNCCMAPYAPLNETGLSCGVVSESCGPCQFHVVPFQNDCLICFMDPLIQCEDPVIIEEDRDSKKTLVLVITLIGFFLGCICIFFFMRHRHPDRKKHKIIIARTTSANMVDVRIQPQSSADDDDDDDLPRAAEVPSVVTVALPV